MTARVRLVWALVLALVAGFGSYYYLRELKQESPVVVAAQDIPERTVITADMLQVIRVRARDRSAAFPNAVSDPATLTGAMAVLEIPRGEVVRNDPRWITRNEGAIEAASKQRLSYFLPKDTRAITLVVDAQGMVGGRVRENDLVDILFTSKDNSTGGVYTAMLLQKVIVLGVDGGSRGAGGGNAAALGAALQSQYFVTLLVTPEQAVDLTLAKRQGTIDLALSSRTSDTVNIPPASPLKFVKMGQSP